MNIIEVYRRFPKHEDCLKHLEAARWKGKPVCPYCKSIRVTPYKKELRHHCNNCNTSFSVTVGTIFHKTKVDLQKWFVAVSLMLNARKGISARQLARDLEINKDTGWYMAMRIRRAMVEQGDLLRGIVEMDETYVGGKPRKGGPPRKRGRGTPKIPVIGLIERGGNVRASVSHKVNAKRILSLVRAHVDMDSATIISDEFGAYRPIRKHIAHKIIDHSVRYALGQIHVNSMESFWAIFKRGIVGQFHKVSVRHLPEYLVEFCYRFNHRFEADVFGTTVIKAVGGMS